AERMSRKMKSSAFALVFAGKRQRLCVLVRITAERLNAVMNKIHHGIAAGKGENAKIAAFGLQQNGFESGIASCFVADDGPYRSVRKSVAFARDALIRNMTGSFCFGPG